MALGVAQQAKSEVPSALSLLFDHFDEANLRWCLLRPWEGLLSPEGDIDILLEPHQFDQVRCMMAELGYVPMRRSEMELHGALLDLTSGRFFWIHVQGQAKVGALTVAAERLLENIRRERFPEVAPEWLLWIVLIRALEKRQVPERYRARLMQLASNWRGGPPEVEEQARAAGLDPDALVAAAAAGDWQCLVANRWPRSELSPINRTRMMRQVRRVWVALRALLAPQPHGLCVAVIGPDGAGKSTLICGLEQTLPLRTRRIYMGLTGGRMQEAASLRLPGLVFAAQATVLWTRFARALLHRAVGEIVLFDRYVLDGAIPSGRPLSLLSQLSRRVQRWAVPLPDLVLFLDASGRTMYDRKGEYASETLEDWRCRYRALEASVHNLVIVDAEQPAADVLRTAQGLIWEKVRQRMTRRGG